MKRFFLVSYLLFLISQICIAQIPTNGLTGYWPFSGYQLANDSSGNNNNGTIHGATLTTDRFGNCNQAYKFNGINNFIEVPTSSTVDMNNTDFTIACWIKTYATDTIGIVLNKKLHTGVWSGYAFVTDDSDPGYCTAYKHSYFYVAPAANQEVCSDSAICKDTSWHFLTGVYRYATNQTYFYVDNVLQSTVGQASGTISNTTDLFFGGTGNTGLGYFNGVIDAARMYQRALGTHEIAQLYAEANPGPGGCNTSICSTPGAAIFKEDFGSGTALYGSALPIGETNYPYQTGVPNNGSYVISSSSDPSGSTGFGGAYIIAPDHTGNSNGYMMVINADYNPDTVYTKTVTGLCPSTTYVFYTYLANNDEPTAVAPVCGAAYIYANVKLLVEYPTGTVQGSISTGNMPLGYSDTTLHWIQYGFMFTTLAGQTSAKIVLINNAPGGCGNDYVVDDISLLPCGAGNLISITGNTVICAGATTTLTASGANSYTWSANAGSAVTASVVVSPTVTTTYTVMADAGTCGNQMAVATVSVTNLPVLINGDTIICAGQTATLTASGASNYIWSANAGGATTAGIVLSPTVTTVYSVVGVTGTCLGQAIATVSVIPHPIISIGGNTVVCTGQSTTLTAVGASYYIWNTGANTASVVLSPTVTTIYSVVGKTGSCISQTVVTVSVLSGISVLINGDTSICVGQNSLLTASGASTYTWNTGATTTSIVVSPSVMASYSVTGGVGTCRSQAVATIHVNTNFDVSMPNIITPNNDGTNDFIDFSKYQFSSMQLEIYNRWGIKVFESTNPACVWKPTEDDGTYFYIVQYIINCNNQTQNKTLKGFITLLR